jgi:hypothetical protein
MECENRVQHPPSSLACILKIDGLSAPPYDDVMTFLASSNLMAFSKLGVMVFAVVSACLIVYWCALFSVVACCRFFCGFG